MRAYNDGAPPLADLTLTVLLPPGVATAGGEQDVLHWKLPPLTADEPALQQVTLHLAEGKATGDAVTRILATLAQPGQTPVQAETWLALAPGARKAENSLTAAGAVVQNASGELVLLAGAESAAAGVTFRLTELYHWQAAPVEAPTEPTPVVLPVAESLTATETLTVTPHAPPAPASESTMQ